MEGENVIAERIKYMITLGIDTANQTLAIGVVEDEQIWTNTNKYQTQPQCNTDACNRPIVCRSSNKSKRH